MHPTRNGSPAPGQGSGSGRIGTFVDVPRKMDTNPLCQGAVEAHEASVEVGAAIPEESPGGSARPQRVEVEGRGQHSLRVRRRLGDERAAQIRQEIEE